MPVNKFSMTIIEQSQRRWDGEMFINDATFFRPVSALFEPSSVKLCLTPFKSRVTMVKSARSTLAMDGCAFLLPFLSAIYQWYSRQRDRRGCAMLSSLPQTLVSWLHDLTNQWAPASIWWFNYIISSAMLQITGTDLGVMTTLMKSARLLGFDLRSLKRIKTKLSTVACQ